MRAGSLLTLESASRFSLSAELPRKAARAMMMMIAFITIKSSLVHLIEGLCAQI